MIGSKPQKPNAEIAGWISEQLGVDQQAPQPCPFREYLKSEQSEGKTEFRIVLKSDNTFYIHPLGKDGVSRDFVFLHSGGIEDEAKAEPLFESTITDPNPTMRESAVVKEDLTPGTV